ILALLAAVAPMLGLLGTVSGMIETFQAITLFGTGDPKLMSGGISQALVTTELGLAVAIPLLILHSILSSKSNQLVQILDEESAAMIARYAEQDDANS
ncbi:MAG TPA: flagellar motor protein MotA, partial [Gammaproteobacteria bacterium]|nr:flagellar motor protein MotA [Gammaproteobacteria bacterium]